MAVSERDAIAALVSDLHWQIDQLRPRGIKNNAGQPVQPVVLQARAAERDRPGGLAVAEYVRGYLYKPPSDGYKKLEDADSLDLACEALVADETKPYAAPLHGRRPRRPRAPGAAHRGDPRLARRR